MIFDTLFFLTRALCLTRYSSRSHLFFSQDLLVVTYYCKSETDRMASKSRHEESEVAPPKDQLHPGESLQWRSFHHARSTADTGKQVRWYRSTFFNITILGLCNFAAPGIWTAMNSLGAGGAASPKLVNAANALTFCLMVLSCYFSSTLVRYIGIKGALIFGTYV